MIPNFLYILFLIIYYIQCKDELLYVHLIPHSHDDYGWLYTIDEYFSSKIIQFGQEYGNVKNILNSVFQEIQKNPDRKFIQVEIGFLSMWWDIQTEEVREKYKELVQKGQIEIVNGGWTMHDEATPYFEDMIDQMTVGHKWVKDKLGVVPTIGWQIDPFGHQSTNAALFSQMGFNGQWFARIDYQDFRIRKSTRKLEMIWQPQEDIDDNYIFSAVNFQHYSPPRDFFFERGQEVTQNNLNSKALTFASYFQNMKQHFQTNHLLHTMGEDFTFSKSEVWYDSIDLLKDFINSRQDQFGMVIQYSTPSQYLQALNQQENTWPVNNHDFYPYADTQNAYWTGYFTSRPSLKVLTKESGRYLQAIRNIFSQENIIKRSKFFANNFQKYLLSLEYFEQQIATLMHHDAVSGTETQRVVKDYILRLSQGYQKIRQILHPLLQEYTQEDINESKVEYTQCNWNTTAASCQVTYSQINSKKPILIMIYNPSISRNVNVRIRIPSVNVSVLNQDNKFLQSNIICSDPLNPEECDLYFQDLFEGYSFKYYKLNFQPSKLSQNIKPLQVNPKNDEFRIEISSQATLRGNIKNYTFIYESWELNNEDFIKSYKQKSYEFSIQYNYYISSNNYGQPSGAYIFRPASQKSQLYSEFKKMQIYKGHIVTVIVLEGNNTTTQMRIYSSNSMERVIEVETFIHSINISDGKGKEIVMLVNTNIQNNQTFYTDSNGLSMQKRVLNYRPTWDLEIHEETSGNYYPIGAMITIKDQKRDLQVSVLNDRSQGGTSLKEGQLEIMVHRRLINDDYRGVGEHLNEGDDIQKGSGLQQKVRHFIVFEKKNEQLSRKIQNELDAFPQLFFSKTESPYFDAQVKQKNNNIIQNKNPYLRIYLRTYDKYYILRLYNINDLQDAEYQLPKHLQILDELTLTANQSKKEWMQKQMKWKGDNGKSFQPSEQQRNLQEEIDSNLVKLKPLQLRVFKVEEVNQE